MQKVNVEVTNVYRRTEKAANNSKNDIIINVGGAGSSKTYSLIQFFNSTRLLVIPNYTLLVLCLERTTVKNSVYRDWIKFLKDIDIYDKKSHNQSELEYKYPLGGYVVFGGADNMEKWKSTQWHDIWPEEANRFSKEMIDFLGTRLYRGVL